MSKPKKIVPSTLEKPPEQVVQSSLPPITPITTRHDLVLMFDVTDGNPNGDPDAGNMPRIEPTSQLGLVTDVASKRKTRAYVQAFPPLHPVPGKDYQILISQGTILEKVQKECELATQDGTETDHARRMRDHLCRVNWDTRTYGQVFSTGKGSPMCGSPYGQIRGPVQFSFARSYHPVISCEHSITRMVSTKLAEEGKKQQQRTMGQKHVIPYGLYRAYISVSATDAAQTGFDQTDYDLLVDAIIGMFEHTQSAARANMNVRGLLDFEHVGTVGTVGSPERARQTALGCAPRQRLFDLVEANLWEAGSSPSCYEDFEVNVDFHESGTDPRFPGIRLHRHRDPVTYWARQGGLGRTKNLLGPALTVTPGSNGSR